MNRSDTRSSLGRTALGLTSVHRLVAFCLLGWAVAASVFVLLDIASPLRAIITLSFLLIAPGMALVRLFQLDEPVLEISLSLALSLALAAIVAMLSLYANAWSFQSIFILLACLTVSCVFVDLLRQHNRNQSARASQQIQL